MWSSSGEMECINTIGGMSEARVHDLSVAFDHHDSDASSSRFLDSKRGERPVEEDNLDSTRDSLGQRGSFQGGSRTINRLMSKLRPNETISQTSHRSNINIGKSGTERRKSKTDVKKAWHSEGSDGFSTLLPAESVSSLAQPPSKASGRPNSYVTRGHAGHLLQRLPSTQFALGSGSQVMQPAHSKQNKSWLGWLFKDRSRTKDR